MDIRTQSNQLIMLIKKFEKNLLRCCLNYCSDTIESWSMIVKTSAGVGYGSYEQLAGALPFLQQF